MKKDVSHKKTLILACKNGKFDIVRDILFRFNHSIEFKDEFGKTPLDYAKENNNNEIYELLKHKIDYDKMLCNIEKEIKIEK